MSTIEQTLNAGVPVTFPGGKQFHLLEAVDPVDVIFYDSRSRPIETWEQMKGGFRIIFEENFIQVKIESATGQTVKIALTSGRGEYDRSQGDVDATLTKASVFADSIDVVCLPGVQTSVLVGNIARRDAYITNLSINTSILRIGFWAQANQGVELAPGETIVFQTTATIRVWNPGSTNQSVGLTWTED